MCVVCIALTAYFVYSRTQQRCDGPNLSTLKEMNEHNISGLDRKSQNTYKYCLASANNLAESESLSSVQKYDLACNKIVLKHIAKCNGARVPFLVGGYINERDVGIVGTVAWLSDGDANISFQLLDNQKNVIYTYHDDHEYNPSKSLSAYFRLSSFVLTIPQDVASDIKYVKREKSNKLRNIIYSDTKEE